MSDFVCVLRLLFQEFRFDCNSLVSLFRARREAREEEAREELGREEVLLLVRGWAPCLQWLIRFNSWQFAGVLGGRTLLKRQVHFPSQWIGSISRPQICLGQAGRGGGEQAATLLVGVTRQRVVGVSAVSLVRKS